MSTVHYISLVSIVWDTLNSIHWHQYLLKGHHDSNTLMRTSPSQIPLAQTSLLLLYHHLDYLLQQVIIRKVHIITFMLLMLINIAYNLELYKYSITHTEIAAMRNSFLQERNQ